MAFWALLLAAFVLPAAGAEEACDARADGGHCTAGQQGSGSAAGEHLLLQTQRQTAKQMPVASSWNSGGSAEAPHIAEYGGGSWCAATAPPQGWHLKQCTADGGTKQEVKVLTYNLYWWNLFGQRGGNGGSAGRLIAAHNERVPFDFMGFQECDDVNRVLGDAGLAGQFQAAPGGSHAVAIAYRASAWTLLESDKQEVAEDRQDQHYGTRILHWARFQSTSGNGKTVFFASHHGPLPVGTGGKCGRHATAYNILKGIADHKKEGDVVILVGDFNSPADNLEISEVGVRLHKVYTGSAFSGIDHVFSSCGTERLKASKNMGSGGSDHDALYVILEI